MPAPRVAEKWRPTLAMIVLTVLLTVLVLPVAIAVWFRSLESGQASAPSAPDEPRRTRPPR